MSTKKLIRNLLFIIIGFILTLVILANVFKDAVVAKVLERSASSFNVPLTVGDVDLSLLRKFPLASIEFNDILLVDSLGDASPDTILSVNKLYASVDIMQFMDGNVFVKKVEVEGATANYTIDSAGVSNLDFIFEAMAYDSSKVEEPDTSKLQGIFELEDLILEDITLKYADAGLHLSSIINLPEVNVRGEVTPSGYMAAIDGSARLNNANYDTYRLEDLSSSVISFDLSAINDSIQVNELKVNAPHTSASFSGQVINGKWPYLDLKYAGEISSLKHLINLLPQKLIKEYKIHRLDGGVALSGTVKGLLSDTLLPRIDASYAIENLTLEYDTLPVIDHLALKGSYTNGLLASNSTTQIYIANFEANTMNNKFTASGDIKNLDEIFYNLKLGANVNLNDWIAYVPDNMVQKMNGKVYASLQTSGVLPDSITDDYIEYAIERSVLRLNANNISIKMDSVPEIKNLSGKLKYINRDIKLSELKVKVPEYNVDITDGVLGTKYRGSIYDVDNMTFNLDTFRLELNNSSNFGGSGYLASINSGEYWLKAYTDLNLNEIKPMIPDTLVTELEGQVVASFISAGKFNIDSIDDQSVDLLLRDSRLSVKTESLTVHTLDSLAGIDNLTTQVEYNDDLLSINKTSGTYNSIDFAVDSASIANLYNAYFLNNADTILVKGNYNAGDLDYAFLTAFMPEEDSSDTNESSESEEEELWTYKFQGKVGVNSFKYGKAIFEDMSSKVLVEPDYYVADGFKVRAFGGDMVASAKYEVGSETYSVAQYKLDLKGMDIQQLFTDFDDFHEYLDEGEEPFITSKQVTGILSSHMDGRVIFGEDYEVNYDSLQVKGNLHLDKGSLINVQAVKDVEDIPMIGLKGLDNLQFSTLDSKIFIFKNKWYVPSTEIRSSSFDANFFGMSSFKEDYSYHIRVFLGEVLASKSKKNLAKQAKENGFEQDDATKGRTSLYLVSRMIEGRSKAWFDKKKDRDKMKKTIRAQQGALNFIFFPKLVNFETGVE
ncbi:AsmA family protein [Saccharicrinis aurantiacus]|uniref:AsmA family protein n=1 Tax=Saccharicrinis aurantiacus TaxID=1849719 RepID=UPI00094F8464|nr:AsmA family protein [Saccharicrinis aurantiacus]